MSDEGSKSLEIARLEPPVSGSDGNQAVPGAATGGAANAVTIFDGRHLGAALTDFVDVRSAAVSTIAVAAFNDHREQSRQLAVQLETCRERLGAAQERYRDEREKRVLLEAADAERKRTSWVEKVALSAGGVVAGVGIPLLIQQVWLAGLVLGGTGVCLMWLGLTLAKRGAAK